MAIQYGCNVGTVLSRHAICMWQVTCLHCDTGEMRMTVMFMYINMIVVIIDMVNGWGRALDCKQSHLHLTVHLPITVQNGT